jgi:hypothetical protein
MTIINKAPIILAVLSIGCTINRSQIDNAPPFVSHSNMIERSFAQSGYVIGCLIGLPVAIISLPITIPLAQAGKDAQSGLIVLSPIFGLGYGLGTIVGGAVWPIAGWYELGIIDDDINPKTHNPRRSTGCGNAEVRWCGSSVDTGFSVSPVV